MGPSPCFVKSPRLELAPNSCLGQPLVFEKARNKQYPGKFIYFVDEPISGTPGDVGTKSLHYVNELTLNSKNRTKGMAES